MTGAPAAVFPSKLMTSRKNGIILIEILYPFTGYEERVLRGNNESYFDKMVFMSNSNKDSCGQFPDGLYRGIAIGKFWGDS